MDILWYVAFAQSFSQANTLKGGKGGVGQLAPAADPSSAHKCSIMKAKLQHRVH